MNLAEDVTFEKLQQTDADELRLVVHLALSTFQHLSFLFVLISGADIAAMCSAAGILALRERRKVMSFKDFEEAKKSVLYRKKMTKGEGLYI